MSGLFIIGSSTDVGKTYVAAAIVRQLASAGRRVGVYKPVASGCRQIGEQLASDDAAALWEAAGRPGSLAQVCPQCFAAPLAPHLAAKLAGGAVDDELLRTGVRIWRETSDVTIVEGAGGWFSPLSDRTLVADLAAELALPIVIVVRNALGAINQALLTVRAVEAASPRLPIAAVVLNQVDRQPDASAATNREEIAARLNDGSPNVPVVALSYGSLQFTPAVDWIKGVRVRRRKPEEGREWKSRVVRGKT